MRWTTRREVCELAWTSIHEELFKKINQEMDDYQGRVQSLPEIGRAHV